MTGAVQYTMMDPSGNVTALVETPTPVQRQSTVAACILAREPRAEQVGFLSEDGGGGLSLRMAGGEFCGNASMSAAVWYGMRHGITAGRVLLRVSGAPEPVSVRISAGENGVWLGEVDMPRPLEIKSVRFDDGQSDPVVFFPGIAHIILERPMPKEQAEQTAKLRCAALHADALGLMFLDRKENTLTPLVYVPGADTLYWESACGSGTSAVGAYLAKQSGETVRLSLRQPGGTPEVTAAPDGALRLRGTVRRLAERETMCEKN